MHTLVDHRGGRHRSARDRALHDHSIYDEAMRGETYYRPSTLHHHGTQWECAELKRINATRPASRICFTLPLSAYEARRHTA